MSENKIQTKIFTFDIGWKRLQVCNFNYEMGSDNMWTSNENISDSKGLHKLKSFEQYWHLSGDWVTVTEAIILNERLFPLNLTRGWILSFERCYGLCVSFREQKLMDIIGLPMTICNIIFSYWMSGSGS
jgi:hypothetical protein